MTLKKRFSDSLQLGFIVFISGLILNIFFFVITALIKGTLLNTLFYDHDFVNGIQIVCGFTVFFFVAQFIQPDNWCNQNTTMSEISDNTGNNKLDKN